MKSMRFWIVLLAILSLPVLDACGPSLVRQRTYQTRVQGQVVDISTATSALSCTGISLPQRPSQANINIAKALLPAPDAAALQILYEEFREVLADGVHNLSGPYGGT